MGILFSQFLLQIVFLTIIFLHLARKNISAVAAYAVQSLAIVLLLFHSFLQTQAVSLLYVVILVAVVKLVLAPVFFIRLIKKNELTFSVSTYLNTPLTLIMLTVFTIAAYSYKFTALTASLPGNSSLLSLSLAVMFLSLCLIINRKSALSQIIGILSLENSIVAFALFAGLEQSLGLQAGILFDISIWIFIATVFTNMVYVHFGSLDVSFMKKLKD